MVAARLQRDIGGGAMGLVTGCMQGMHFGVRFAGFFVPAFADDLAIANQHTTDAGLGEVVHRPRSASCRARAIMP